MKLAHRSPKSKEKFADGLMSVANAIHAAALIGVLVFPLTAFITAVFSGGSIYSPTLILTKLAWNDIAFFWSGLSATDCSRPICERAGHGPV